MNPTVSHADRTKGILLLLLSALSFALMSMFVRLAGDLPVAEKGMFRNALSVFLSGFVLLRAEKGAHSPTFRGKLFLVLRAVLGTAGLICNFYAVSAVNMADATILNKLSPFFTVIFSCLLLGDHIRPRRVLIIIGIFLGSLLVIKPAGTNLLLVPLLVAALGGVTAGAAYTCVRGAVSNGVSPAFLVFFFSVFSTLTLLPSTIIHYAAPSAKQWLYLIGCGVCGCSGQLSITAAYSHAPASEISGYDYAQVLFSAIIGFFVFSQIPDLWSVVGYVIIIGLGILDFCLRKDG